MDFFCTCGRGTEIFVIEEVCRKLNIDHEKQGHHKSSWLVHTKRNVFTPLSKQFRESVPSFKPVDMLFPADGSENPCEPINSVWALKSAFDQVDAFTWKGCLNVWLEYFQKVGVQGDSRLEDCVEDEVPKKKRCETVTFRVSAKCSGAATKLFDSQSLSSLLGKHIAKVTGWTTDIRKPQIEIYVQLNQEGLIVGIPCTSVPLSKRPYLKHAGVRTTIASIMASLARIQDGMTVLDPMCGQGTVLIEAAQQCQGALYIGCDINNDQCSRAVENLEFSRLESRIHLLQCDASRIPFMSSTIDAVLLDIPFGQKHFLSSDLSTMLVSLDRVLKCDGRFVLLCGAHLKDEILTSIQKFSGPAIDVSHSRCSSDCDNSSANIEPSHEAASVSDKSDMALHLVVRNLINRLDGIQSDSSDKKVDCVDSDVPTYWKTELVHYVKLGETHAYVCVFSKSKKVNDES